ncbi:heme biosynthesis HemY N-terminal domain-containing protein [Stenotrophomonas sp. MH1]|uniref:Heme biosynthesis HemY N-terminal domain-containing protein n=1 Tax=Stenotrophomonas capsici TaxID=3110230 RepID=A0ABU5V518_9GAMM|nr:heme biosynthesis HemY N-terminal domain-containing protein [Stenotrophomonas sp. MH1]MEA5667640.1 heme biosynthesis HemY N-terminal domain-containing protein [Stenotrophomonas sp. MH1]
MKAFRSLLIVLLVAALGIFGAQWMGQASVRALGEVIVRAGNHDYIATLPQAVLALLIVLLLLWLLWTLVSTPFRVWARHRRGKGRARLIDGLQALDGGQWQRAEKLLQSAATEKEVRPIALVAAMRAAEARDDAASAGQHLQQLGAVDPTLHALHSAERWLELDKPLEAITALDLPGIQPLPPRGLSLRTEALARAGRAEEAYGQLGALRQQQALPPPAVAALETRLALQMLDEAVDANALAARWEVLPKTLRVSPQAVARYASRAVALNWNDVALRVIEQTLDSSWDEALVTLYGTLPVDKLDSRRASAQRWLQSHPSSPALLLTLARLARGQGQWTQAEEFLHRAIAQGAGPDAWEALGEGFAAQGEDALARQCLLNALHQRRGDTPLPLERRDLRQQIQDQAVAEERDEHGFPRLPG